MATSPTPTLHARREVQRAAFRGDVLAATRAIIAEEGVGGLSMRKLAQRLGCSPMSVYAYFRDKHDLLTALAHQGFDALAERLAAERSDDALADLRAVYLSYARLGLERPDDYRVLFMTPETQPARETKGTDEIARENPAFAVALDRARLCVETGLLVGDAHAIATLLWTTVHGAVAAHLAFPAFPFGGRETYVARVVDWAISALRAERTEPLA